MYIRVGWEINLTNVSTGDARKVISLVQSECCNYYSGDCGPCDCKCAQVTKMRPGGRAEGESPFVCRWFLDAVLPLDKNLQASLIAPHDMKKCERCGIMFAAGSNSAKYCTSCAAAEHKKIKREYAQKKRTKM